jgi:hypothetical protein
MKGTMMMVMLSAGMLMLLGSVPASAAVRGCSFKKTLQQGGYVFDVSSRPADGCAVQILEVAVRRGGKPFASFKADVDFLAGSAWTADLNGDGKPELAVASRSVNNNGRGTFDVYWLEGNVLQHAALSKHEEGAGYQGQDSFRLNGSKIVRSFPVYRDGDPDNRPSGGTRTLQYTFRDGRLELNGKSDEFATTAAVAIPEPPLRPVAAESRPVVEKQGPAAAAPSPVQAASAPTAAAGKPVIQRIVSGSSFIDIQANSPIAVYKLLKLDKPARLAIDIPRATSSMAKKSIAIGSNGIAKARVGDNPGFLRIVLDSTQASFPAHSVTPTENGLRIEFARQR